MKKIIFFLLFFPALFCDVIANTLPESTKIRPIFCVDGDTFIAAPDNFVYRLWGVDAPELDQACGLVARAALIALVHKKNVTIIRHGISYNRPVVEVKAGNIDIALELLKMGLAHYCPKYAPKREDYAAAEASAKQEKRGLWSQKKVTLPAEYRREKNCKKH